MPNFPVSYDDDESLFLAVNNGRTKLTIGISDSELDIPVVTTSGFPPTGFITILSDPNDITKAEAIRYDGLSELTFSGTERGAGGTPIFAHNSQDYVDLTVMAEHHNEIKDAVIALEHFVGVSGSPEFVPKDEFGNVLITGTLTVENLVEAGWVTTSGSAIICGPGVFKDTLTVSGIATFGEIPFSTLPDSLGSFDDTTGTLSTTGFTTVHTTPALPPGENLVFYRGNIGIDSSSAGTGNTEIRARYGGSLLGGGYGNSSVKVGHTGGAETAGFKVITSDGVTTANIQAKVGSGSNTGQYGALGIVSVPLEQMSLVSGTDYWHTNGVNDVQVDSSTGWTDYGFLDFTAPENGEYLILYSSEIAAGIMGRVRFLLDGVPMSVQAESGIGDLDYGSPCPGAVIETLTAGPHTLQMQQATNTAFITSSYSHRTRFFVLKTSAFDQIQGVSSAVEQSTFGSSPQKLTEYTQTYTPKQSEQLLILGVAGFKSATDYAAAGYSIRNDTDGEYYSIDSGQHIYNEGSLSDDVDYRPTLMFHLLDDVIAPKDFYLTFRQTAGGTITNTDGSLILWGMSAPIVGGNVAFTTINGNTITTHKVEADCVDVSQSATVSGIPVMIEIPDPTVLNNLTVTGTATIGDLNVEEFTTISGAVSQELTVSGIPVSTNPGVTEINSITGGLTISGVGSVVTIESGQVILISGTGEGGAGGGVSECYTHDQPSAATTWSISHGFDTSCVNYIVFDASDFQIYPDSFQLIDSNTSEIAFVSPQAGKAAIWPCSASAASGTLQDAYDAGDGTIVTTGGKPFELQGLGEIVAVTGTFTDGITIGTASTHLDDKSITTASGVFESVTVSGIPVSTGPGGGGSALTVKEADGVPSVDDVDTIVVTNGTLTDDGGGQVTIDTGGSGGGSGGLGQVAASGTIWMPEVAPASGTVYDDEFVEGEASYGAGSIWTLWDPGTNIHTVTNDEAGLYMRNSNATGEWMGIFQDVPPDGATGRWVAFTYVSMSAAADLSSGYRKVGFAMFEDASGAPTTTDFQFLGLTSSPTNDWAIERGLYTGYTDTSPSSADYDKATTNGLHLNGVFLRAIKTNDGVSDHTWEFAYSFDGVGWKSMSSSAPSYDVAQIGIVCVNGAGTTLYRYASKFFRIDSKFNGASMRVQPMRGNYLDPTGGGSGGGGASTLQEAYAGGDGTISTTGGKPFELTGTGELVAVTGTFTDGLTVGTGSTTIDNDSITTASGFFSDLYLNGLSLTNPVPGHRGARLWTTSGTAVPSSTTTYAVFDETDYDTDGFYNGYDGFIVPAGINTVRVRATVTWPFDDTGARLMFIRLGNKDGLNTISNVRSQSITTLFGNVQLTESFPLSVVEGDTFVLGLHQDSGSTLNTSVIGTAPGVTGFEIEVIDPVATTPNDLQTISGSFTQSLTISGVPVATGASGGGGALEFIGSYPTDGTRADIELSSGYRTFELHLVDFENAEGVSANVQIRQKTVDTTGYTSSMDTEAAVTAIRSNSSSLGTAAADELNEGSFQTASRVYMHPISDSSYRLGIDADQKFNGVLKIHQMGDASNYSSWTWDGAYFANDDRYTQVHGSNTRYEKSRLTGLRFELNTAGDFNGTVYLYGYPE